MKKIKMLRKIAREISDFKRRPVDQFYLGYNRGLESALDVIDKEISQLNQSNDNDVLKFKVGDPVKNISNVWTFDKGGNEGVVIEVDENAEDQPYLVRKVDSIEEFWLYEYEIELINK